ncbi:hypothetical protein PWT90_00768 [Aphanocladium album]|nr:hypothetical protein PWT90_00768 [Aphanocladium album]
MNTIKVSLSAPSKKQNHGTKIGSAEELPSSYPIQEWLFVLVQSDAVQELDHRQALLDVFDNRASVTVRLNARTSLDARAVDRIFTLAHEPHRLAPVEAVRDNLRRPARRVKRRPPRPFGKQRLGAVGHNHRVEHGPVHRRQCLVHTRHRPLAGRARKGLGVLEAVVLDGFPLRYQRSFNILTKLSMTHSVFYLFPSSADGWPSERVSCI